MQRCFISSPAELEQRLAETEPQCDPDGRYRTSSFFGHDDTWKMVLGRLAESSDAVLMDLRGFTKEARGCIHEINELLNTVPLERIVFVVDGLVRVLFDSWARLGAASPNRADLTPHVRLVRFDGLYGRNIANLVALLAATASVNNPVSSNAALADAAGLDEAAIRSKPLTGERQVIDALRMAGDIDPR